MLTHEDTAELLGAYALDAVDPDERDAIEAHLVDCPRCRDEVAHHREVAAALAFVGSAAPEGLWTRIAARLESAPPPTELARLYPLQRRRVNRGLVATALAVAAAIILALGLEVNHQRHDLAAVKRAIRNTTLDGAVQAALLQPGATKVQLQSNDHHTYIDAVLTRDGTGYLVTNNLPTLASGRTYQLWGVIGGAKISLGVLGSRPAIVPFRVSAPLQALAVTEEVAGGVSATRQPPVVVGPVRGTTST